MHTVCTQYTHSMHTVYTQYTHSMPTVYTQYAHSIAHSRVCTNVTHCGPYTNVASHSCGFRPQRAICHCLLLSAICLFQASLQCPLLHGTKLPNCLVSLKVAAAAVSLTFLQPHCCCCCLSQGVKALCPSFLSKLQIGYG